MSIDSDLASYELTPLERQVFLLLFLCMRSDPRSMLPILQALKVRAEASKRTVRSGDVEPVFARLMQAGLVRRDRGPGFRCIALPLASQRELFRQPEVKPYLAAIEHSLNRVYYMYPSSCLAFMGRSRLEPFSIFHQALIEDRLDDARHLLPLHDLSDMHSWHDYVEFALPPMLREPDGVAPRVLLYLFPDLSRMALATCAPASGLSRLVAGPAALALSDLPTPRLFCALCAWHTWTASRDGLAHLAKAASGVPWQRLLAACVSLLDGDAGSADRLFAQAMKSRIRDGAVVATDCIPLVALAALAAIRANQSTTRVRSLLRRLDDKLQYASGAGEDTASLGNLDAVANRGEGAMGTASAARAAKSVLDAFVRALETLFLPDGSIGKKRAPESLNLLRMAHEAGYGWMAASLVPCVRRLLPDDPQAADLCRQVAASVDAVPLWEKSHIVQPWEQALKEIGELLPRTNATGRPDDTESGSSLLQWLLVLDISQPDNVRVKRVVVRARKRLKSGKWSSGKHIDLPALLGSAHDALLDARDMEVKAALGQRIGSRDLYYINFEEAYCIMPALIDHPRVCLILGDGSRHISYYDTLPIRIVRGDPAVEIRATHGGRGTELRLPWRANAAYEDVQIVQERDDVFTVYEKGPLHQRLAGIVRRYGTKNRLVIPAEGGDALKGLLAPLAKVIGIKGEFDAEAVDARLIEGGVQFRLRARFVNGVLHLDLVNQPVPDLPLYVAPGSGMRKTLSRLADETVAVCRDLDGERAALAAFTEACPALAAWAVAPHHWEVGELREILTVLDEVHGMANPITLEWPEGQPLEVVRPGSGAPFALSGSAGADYWLEIGGDVTLDDGKVMAFTDLLSTLGDRNERFVPLSEGRYLSLTRNLMRQLELLAKAGEVSKQKLRLPPAALPLLDAMAAADAREGLDFPSLIRDRLADFRKAFQHKAPLPASLTCELRPYQQEGFVWLSRLAACGLGACLADDMGLGKTIQMLALLTARAPDGPSLVIAPTSVSRNWVDEAARFAPALRVTLLAETQDRAACVRQARPFDVIVSSYGLLTFEQELLTSRPWSAVILDEAQAVKNRLAKRTRIVKRLDARLRAVATGTPVENNLGELWNLFDFLNPGLLGSHGRFEQRFCNSDGSISPLLKRMTAPFILRRLKSEVLDDLPPKTEITLSVTLDDDERSLYESCRREALASLESTNEEANRITILAHLTKLRRACCHPSLLLPGSKLPGQKVETFLNLVDDLRASGHRALVFSQFVDFLGIVRRRLDQADVSYQYLDGATPLGQRAEAVSRFQRGEGDLFLISLKAGGTGLNLTAANFVILLDPWWNPAVEMQAADRAHRIGQRNPVTIYRLVTADTVEERVVELHARKRAMAEELLEGTGSTRLSASDMVALFRA